MHLYLIKHRENFDESVFSYENKLYKKRLEIRLRKQAKILGLELVAADS